MLEPKVHLVTFLRGYTVPCVVYLGEIICADERSLAGRWVTELSAAIVLPSLPIDRQYSYTGFLVNY